MQISSDFYSDAQIVGKINIILHDNNIRHWPDRATLFVGITPSAIFQWD